MRKDLDEALVRDFPNLYRERNISVYESCMGWGFGVGDGWEPLIRRLSEKLEPLGVTAHQVKEKFGGLRFYSDAFSKEAEDAIAEAELEAERTCEACGAEGRIRTGGWLKCLCDKHAEGQGCIREQA